MTYTIKKSDGTTLVDILDGTIDQTTDLNLIGKNSTTFGESLNENLVHLLENFSNSSPPSKPLMGQLWYNTEESRLQIYTGNTNGWRPTGSPLVSQSQPTSFVTGDFWIDSNNKQLWFFDGTALTLAGPIWTKNQGKTGFIAETLFDRFGNSKPVLKLYVSDSLLGIYSASEFTPVPEFSGFTTLVKGYTSSTAVSNLFNITVNNSNNLIVGTDGSNNPIIVSGSNFVRRDVDSSINGQFSIASNGGLTLGAAGNVKLKLSGFALQIENSRVNGDISIRTKNANDITNDNIYISASSGRIGILTDNPQQTLDVNGDSRIRGNFEVDGKILTKPIVLTLIDNDIVGYPNVTRMCTGIINEFTITTTSTTGIHQGMTVIGTGIGIDAVVTTVNSLTQLTLSVRNTGAVSASLTFIDPSSNNKTNLILNDVANTSNYLDNQQAIVHYQTIDFSTGTITRKNKRFVIVSGVWTYDRDLTSSV